MVHRNPPTPGYVSELSGLNARAFIYPNKTVEIIVKENDVGNIDWSRDAMILARAIAPTEAKKHLPDIRRDRLVINEDGDLEFIYKMPFYEQSFKFSYVKECNSALDNVLSGNVNSTLEKAIKAIIDACKRLRKPFEDDMYSSNLSLDKNGTLILRDPIVMKASIKSLEKKWNQLGFATKQSSINRNPPTPGYDHHRSGGYAVAYFYPDKRVELILTEDQDGMVDWSREVLILARELAVPSAKKHLPEIKRVRVDSEEDIDGSVVLEFVYEMPVYRNECSWQECSDVLNTLRGNVGFQYTTLAKAWNAIREACKQIHVPLNEDVGSSNLSLDSDGNIILRDPIYVERSAGMLLDRWIKIGAV